MPRTGPVYNLPAGSLVTDGVDPIQANQHNTPLQDIAADLNEPRPVEAGGTGASSPSGARENLGVLTPGIDGGQARTNDQNDARFLRQSENLSDLDDAAEARGNLGVAEDEPQTLTNKTIAFGANTLTDVAGTTATQTLTNKTIAFGDNTLTDVAGTTAEQTLTNKTIAFGDNTLTDVAGTTAEQTLTNKTIADPELTGEIYVNGSYRGNLVDVPALEIDCSLGNYFTKSITVNSTFTFSNVPSDRSYAFTLRVAVFGDRTINWPASVKFPGDQAPILTENKTHIFVFVTDDGGTTFRGAFLADYGA